MRKNRVIREKRGKLNFVKCGNPERNALLGWSNPPMPAGSPDKVKWGSEGHFRKFNPLTSKG